MMEYFNPEEVDALSLQDMIDCDIKTDIDNLLQIQHSEKMSSLEYCLQQINSCEVGNIHNNNNNLEYIPLNLEIPMDTKHSWGTSEAERLHQLVEVENTDPNLLVNPQTGVPVHHEQMDSDTTNLLPRLSMNGQTPTIVGLISTTPHQYITETTLNSISTTASNSPSRLSSVSSGHSVTFPQSSPAGQIRDNGKLRVDIGMASPSQTNPVLLEQLQNPIGLHSPGKMQCVTNTHLTSFCRTNGNLSAKPMDSEAERVYAKPAYSYSCLIAMALKNSKTGSLPVSEIYHFMTSNFPYFKTAPDGWKNSVRHNLSLNKCFEKVENPNNTGNTRKGCLWGLNPAKVEKMEEEIVKWRKKDPESVKNSLANPDHLELIESGRAGSPPSPSQRRPSQTSDHDITEVSTDQCVAQVLLASDDDPSKQKSVAEMLSVDMTGLDSSLTLDPVLSELASQSGLWDDDLPGDLKLDVPFSSSPLTTCNSPLLTQPSPLTGFTSCDSTIQGSYVYTTAPFHLIDGSPASKQITIYTQSPARTLSAQT